MINIKYEIERLLAFGHKANLVGKADIVLVRNQLLELFNLDEPYNGIYKDIPELSPTDILKNMLDYASENGMLKYNSDTYRDLLDAKIMGLLMPRPSQVMENFWRTANNKGIEQATNEYYQLSKDSNYIRIDRIEKNLAWEAETDYGNIEITINLSKPEKDPREIAEAKNNKNVKYPKCLLCLENVGYQGRTDHYARQNHRVIPLRLAGEQWYFQYSPYVYYNEHCIIFSEEHSPMKIGEETFRKMFDFIDQFPHYFVGSNADLPIVGGSILSHDHFQGGRHEFPMAKASCEVKFSSTLFPNVEISIVKWPMSVIRLKTKNYKELIKAGLYIYEKWKNYSDEANEILAFSGDIPHNTVTPIGRKRGEYFEFDIVLRNNRTDEEHPMGIFHPNKDLHHIKKENIGLIEVMGLAILPGRLKDELREIANMLKDSTYTSELDLSLHKEWIDELKEKYQNTTKDIERILEVEVGIKFSKVLEDAGVFKRDKKGQKAFYKFIESIKFQKIN